MRYRIAVCVLALLAAGASRAVPVVWNTDLSGDWNDPASWDVGVPTMDDDVTIDRGAADPTVTHGAGASSAGSLQLEEDLVVDGGTLDVGTFTAGTGSSVRVAGTGVRFSAGGPTQVDGASLFASDGGLLDLSLATSYSALGRRTLQASGSASRIDLSGVTSLTGSTFFRSALRVEALAGGEIDLSGTTDVVDSSIAFSAVGAGSQVDVSSVTSFVDTGTSFDRSSMEARNGGALLLSSSQPVAIQGYSLTVEGASSSFDTSQVTSLVDSTLTAIGDGVSFDLGSLGSFDGNSFIAESGASLTISGSSYAAGAGREFLRADGSASAASTIDASSLTDLSGSTAFRSALEVEALDGGLVDLSNVTSLGDSSLAFRADGAGSRVDLSSLTSFVDTGTSFDRSSLEASGGGTVALAGTGPLSIDGYLLKLDGAGSTLDTSQLTSLTNSTVEAIGLGATFDLSGLASFDGNSYLAGSGASLTISGASYAAGAGRRNLRASGADGGTASLLDASSVTDLSGSTLGNSELVVEALAGGVVDLSNVSSLADSSVQFIADGAGSLVDLSSLASFLDTGSSLDQSSLEAKSGGTIELFAGALAIDGYTLRRDGVASTFDTSLLTSLDNSTVDAIGLGVTFDLSGLTSFDGNSFLTDSGASLAILSTSYAAGQGQEIFRARGSESGTASTIDGSSLTSLVGSTLLNSELVVEAQDGGLVDLSNVASLADSSVRFLAEGAGSLVDLSSLSTYLDTGPGIDRSSLEASNGGTVLLPASPTSIDGYLLRIRGATSALDTSQVTSLTNSTANAIGLGATLDLGSLASFDGNSFIAEDGAELEIATSAYVAGSGGRSFRATGVSGTTASRIDGGSITSLVGVLGGATATLSVKAEAGGQVDLSALASITGGKVDVEAVGAGSLVDLSALTSFEDTANALGASSIRASGGGTVQLPSASTAVLTGVDLHASLDGTIVGDTVEIAGGSRVIGEGSLDLARVVVDGGALAPGIGVANPASITLNGDYEQTAAGTLAIDIAGLLSVDFLEVMGTATLGGEIQVDFLRPSPGEDVFDPEIGDVFDVLVAGVIVDAGIAVTSGLSGGRLFDTRILRGASGDTLQLVVVVPEPSTSLLLALGLVLVGRGRRP